MLKLTIPEQELFNEATQEFVKTKKTDISLEHSLISISKWESKWHKPFLSTEEKTVEEITDYIRCMCINSVDENVFAWLTQDNIRAVNEYISDPMTATWITDNSPKGKKEIITSEIIYYWLIAYQIPFECQKWHINRLMMLVRVCAIKNSEANGDSKKMSRSQTLKSNKALNAARKAKMNSRG